MVFGHSTRSLAPAHRSAFAVEWHLSMEESGMTLTLVIGIFENRDRCIHSRFKVKRVESGGCDCECGGGRDYRIKSPSGTVLWRNRRFLRPYRELIHEQPTDEDPPSKSEVLPVDVG